MRVPAKRVILLCALLFPVAALQGQEAPTKELLDWHRLPDLPDPIGVGGPCAGISNGALIVAGGAHFRDPFLQGGEKIWTDSIYVLTSSFSEWKAGFALARPTGYAVASQWEDEVICAGGGNAREHFKEVIALHWDGESISQRSLPALPQPRAFASGAVVESTLYIAGGLETPDDTVASRNFWALNLADPGAQWKILEPVPGTPRHSAVTGASDGAFYLFSGTALEPDTVGATSYEFLTDAYRYHPSHGWEQLHDLPYPAAAAPSPAITIGPSHLLVLGGNTGADVDRVQELGDRHPGFSRDVLAYHVITDTWAHMGTLPMGQVTVPMVQQGDHVFIPSGEIRPGVRTAAVWQATPSNAVPPFGTINFVVVTVYFLILAGMGLYFWNRGKSDTDYFLARRRIPWWAAGISIFGTQLSAITFMAIPAKAYATDWVYFLGQIAILLVAPIVVYLYLPFFRRLQITTAYEFLEQRFSVAVRLFGSLAFVLLQLGRMGVVIFLPALALSAVTGFNLYLAILLMGLLSTFYTALGGMEAVIWSDVMQVIVLLGGALLSLIILVMNIEGGASGLIEVAASENKFHMLTWSWDATTTAVWVVLGGSIFSNLIPYTADQTVVQRYLTTKTEKLAARSVWTNAALTIPGSLLFFSVGTALFVFYQQHAGALEPSLSTDAIFPLFIVQQLPQGISGLLIAGIFAAAMSSLDSSLNSAVAALVCDFYKRFKPHSTAPVRLRLAKWLTVGLGFLATAIGLLMATIEIASLFDFFLELLGLLGSSLAGLFALGIFTRRAHSTGALIGACTSAVVLYLVSAFTTIHFFLYASIGILTCFVVGYIMSNLLPNPRVQLDGLTIYTLGDRLSNYDRDAAD